MNWLLQYPGIYGLVASVIMAIIYILQQRRAKQRMFAFYREHTYPAPQRPPGVHSFFNRYSPPLGTILNDERFPVLEKNGVAFFISNDYGQHPGKDITIANLSRGVKVWLCAGTYVLDEDVLVVILEAAAPYYKGRIIDEPAFPDGDFVLGAECWFHARHIDMIVQADDELP